LTANVGLGKWSPAGTLEVFFTGDGRSLLHPSGRHWKRVIGGFTTRATTRHTTRTHLRGQQLDVPVLHQQVQYRFDVVRDGRFQTVELLGQSVHTMVHVGVAALRT